jgi:hypothetical protein
VPRFFSLLEAESLLPEVERLLRNIVRSKLDLETSDAELSEIAQRIALLGGSLVPRDRLLQIRTRKESAARSLKLIVSRVQEIGCQLKDVESGLVDFPTLYRGEEVYLCWKLGEPSITSWHHVADGFAGRRPIDSEFLQNHRGD